MSITDGLTYDQRRAVETIDDNLEIIACAGAGKTGVVTRRIINILKTKPDIKPENIVAFTFTEKAAVELKNRIYKYAHQELGNAHGLAHMYIGTIHGFCLKILQEYVQYFQKFSVLDEMTTSIFIERNNESFGMRDLGLLGYKIHDLELFIKVMDLVNENSFDGQIWPPEIESCAIRYQQTFYDNRYFDFSLILKETVNQLRTNEELRNIIKNKIKYLTVDEYQDVNPIQERLIRLLFELGCNLCVVGDDDQTIYQFRGSDVSHILSFEKNYGIKPENKVILSENFRCTSAVVDVAQTIIKSNHSRLNKEMRSASRWKHEDGTVSYMDFDNTSEEYSFIAERIKSLHSAGIKYSDLAVLLRKSKVGAEISHIFDAYDIPYIIEGVNELFMTNEAVAAGGIFRFLDNVIDSEELKALWNRIRYAIDSASLENAISSLKQIDLSSFKGYSEFSIQQVFHNFIIDLGIREIEGNDDSEVILYNLGKFSQVIDDFERMNFKAKPVSRVHRFCFFLGGLADGSYAEGHLENTYIRPDAVNIMTIHKSKGLEFTAVFIPQLNRNYFPAGGHGGRKVWYLIPKNCIPNANRYDGTLEDERRLFYVAITRAKKFLFLTRSPSSVSSRERTISQFLVDARHSKYLIRDSGNVDYSKMGIPPTDAVNAPIGLNFSILQDFFDCPYRFKLSFFYGFIQPIIPGLGYGVSMHEIVMNIHRRFINGDPVEKEELPKIIDDHFFLRYAPQYIEENMRGKAEKSIIDYYDREIDQFKNIQHAETDIEIDLGDNIKVNGRIDLVKKCDLDGNIKTFIVDFKTQRGDISECIDAEQLKIYALGYRELSGEKADYMEVCNLDNCDYQRELITDKTFEDVEHNIRNAAEKVRSNKMERKCDKQKCSRCYLSNLCLSKSEKLSMGI